MKHLLGCAAAGALVASVAALRNCDADSYDATLLLVGVWLQCALLVSLYAPCPDALRSALASLAHFGFVVSLVYSVVAGGRPTLLLATWLLLLTLLSRLVVRGCLYSLAEDPHSTAVQPRASWSSDWQLLGIFLVGVCRLLCVRFTPGRGVQALVAFAASVGAACVWGC